MFYIEFIYVFSLHLLYIAGGKLSTKKLKARKKKEKRQEKKNKKKIKKIKKR